MVPVKNQGELRWCPGLFYEKGLERGTLTISQRTFAEKLAQEYISWGYKTPMSASVNPEDSIENEQVTIFPFGQRRTGGVFDVAGKSE